MKLLFRSWFFFLGLMTLYSDPVRAVTSGLFPENPNLPPRCQTRTVVSMLQSSCEKMDLRDVPTHLKSSIQVLILNHNRIRTLTNQTFLAYPNLKFLYLADNLLRDLEQGTFEAVYYLEVLDLQTNAITVLPKGLLHMPSLRKLYLSDNFLTDADFDGTATAPLRHLDLSSNQLTRLPDLGPNPYLLYLNVSHNRISKIFVDDIAPFCSLQELDLRKNVISWEPDSCDCHEFVFWVNQNKIEAKYDFKCPNLSKCRGVVFSNETLETWTNCTRILEMKKLAERARTTWVLVGSCLTVFCVVLLFSLCYIHRRNNKKRQRKLKEEQKLAANAMQNAELLHNQHNT